MLTLGRGALTGIGKHPSAEAELPPVRLTAPAVRIDPARLAAYAEVCGFASGGGRLSGGARSSGSDRLSGGGRLSGGDRLSGRDRLPLTYPHILGFPLAARIMAARAFPLPMLGLVHTSIDLVAYAPLTAADRPDITAYAAGLRRHRRGTEAELVTEARLDGELVWRDRSTYLARHGATPVRDKGSAPAEGAGLPAVAEWRLPADLGRRHARVSRDWNPIHLYPLTARPFGFPRAIAHGMWTVARCAAQNPDAERLRAAFHAPVLLPTTVTYAADGSAFEVRSGSGTGSGVRVHLTGTM
ncbi:MaoC/PaaZ C-terminal domain-containing protein [Actinacidiphila alni]|uniref:MaoC family dehydratase n=1 Tax=Actinacidiphila alni TaxID=380248 RepID=UPI003F4F48CB